MIEAYGSTDARHDSWPRKRIQGVRCLPQPVQQPHPPIWIGGHSRPALRRVAKYGDGWHPVGANPAVPLRPHELQAALADLKRRIAAEGRHPDAVTISFKAPLYSEREPRPHGALRHGHQARRRRLTRDAIYADPAISSGLQCSAQLIHAIEANPSGFDTFIWRSDRLRQ
jgi:Luciferase-like monooxygenase